MKIEDKAERTKNANTTGTEFEYFVKSEDSGQAGYPEYLLLS